METNELLSQLQQHAQQWLQPISPEGPCGEDLTFSLEFDAIQKARTEDDPNLSQGEWATELKVADWPEVVKTCNTLLKEKTKDLRVAAWLTEALAQTKGFGGLAEGCALLQALCEQYWEQIHPLAEDNDQELRIGALANFVQRNVQVINAIPLTDGVVDGNSKQYSSRDFDAAQQFESAAAKDPDLRIGIPEYKVTLAKFTTSQQKTSRRFYEHLNQEFFLAKQVWQMLAKSIDQRLGVDGPSFTPVFDAFAQVERLVNRLVREAGIFVANAQSVGEPSGEVSISSATAEVVLTTGTFSNRTQALQQLERVADYFRRTEPHSPVAYLASKAAQWGNMPLHDWLRTVVKDSSSLAHIEELLGLKQVEHQATDGQN